MNKGQSLLQVILWAGGFSLSTVALASSVFIPKISAIDDLNLEQAKQISSVEAKIERLPIIEDKLDALLFKEGIEYKTK